MTKVCTRCKKEKAENKFYLVGGRNHAESRRAVCAKCMSEQYREKVEAKKKAEKKRVKCPRR